MKRLRPSANFPLKENSSLFYEKGKGKSYPDYNKDIIQKRRRKQYKLDKRDELSTLCWDYDDLDE